MQSKPVQAAASKLGRRLKMKQVKVTHSAVFKGAQILPAHEVQGGPWKGGVKSHTTSRGKLVSWKRNKVINSKTAA